MMRGRCSVLFSATLLPIRYYKQLLGADEGDYEVYAKSVFDARRKGLFIANDVTSKYSRRTESEYYNIASYLHRIVQMRTGNYMVFFPSHAFLKKVLEVYEENFADEYVECLVQDEYMNEQSREEFLMRFGGGRSAREISSAFSTELPKTELPITELPGIELPITELPMEAPPACKENFLEEVIHMEIEYEENRTLLGFCVLGGIFSEGIDLKKDQLIGAIIVGTGLPMVCNEREILKKYFDRQGDNGFDYAYRYPGMNKVLQAAGRLIRTSEDYGVIALLDERFLQGSYRSQFPPDWTDMNIVQLSNCTALLEQFWADIEQ